MLWQRYVHGPGRGATDHFFHQPIIAPGVQAIDLTHRPREIPVRCANVQVIVVRHQSVGADLDAETRDGLG